jgi:hypothetical protein
MIVAIVVTIIAIIIYNIYYAPKIYTFAPTYTALSVPTVELPSADVKNMLERSEFTFSMYVFITGVDRSSAATGATAAKQIFGVDGAFRFSVGPSETTVTVSGDATAPDGTTIHLPQIPYQKWVYVTIACSGRKIDVMYDDTVVGTKMAKNIVQYVANPLIVGNAAVSGSYIYGTAAAYRKTRGEIASARSNTSDTRGQPILSLKERILSIFNGMPSVCLPGVRCNDTVSASPGLLNMWETPYG